MKAHEAADIFPMNEESIPALAEDIRQHGQKVPIEIYDGLILDGRRRYRACVMAGVEPQTREVSPDDPVAYVLSLNLHRRQLSPSQKAMVAGRARELYDAQAAERMSAGGGDKRSKAAKSGMETFPYPIAKGAARDLAGKAVGVSGKLVDWACKVLSKGTPELVTAVDSDLISVGTAARYTSFTPIEQNLVVERAKENAAKGKPKRRRPSDVTHAADDPPREAIEPTNGSGLMGVGVIRANEAINCLISIPKHDALRNAGLDMVAKWIRVNRKG